MERRERHGLGGWGVEQTGWSAVGQFRIPLLWVFFLIKN